MAKFGMESESNLATVDPELVRVLRTAIQIKDFKVICGHRGEEAQHEAFLSGASKLDWPKGKHNSLPSKAADVRPWDQTTGKAVPYSNSVEYAMLAGVILACAHLLEVRVRWGHDWNSNMLTTDEQGKLVDMPHFELY
jgi:peptidoglycan L-alanyl-D-glutamate endopeptidase CwlK